LSAIKGCGAGAAEALANERKTNGPFKNLFDVCQRVEVSRCGRSSLESLIKAGAMDCFGARRSQLFAVLDKALQVGAARHKDKLSGQRSLFDEGDDVIDEEEATATVGLPDVPEMDERQKLAAEKEVLGFYLSSHPLAAFEDQLTRYCSHKTTTIGRLKDRDRVSMGGMLSSIKLSHVKNPKDGNSPTKYVMFDLEDVEGAIRCILWPQEYAKFSQFIVPDAIVVMQGRLDFRGGDEANLIVDKVVPINQLSESMAQGIRIRIDERELGGEKLRVAHEVLRGYPGDRMLKIQLALQNGTMVDLDSKRRIEVNEELFRRLRDVLGETNVETLIDEKSLSAKADPAPKWRRS
jgi:DNA polymerase-3 subunit alpha